mgnify:CR=1 FL=1
MCVEFQGFSGRVGDMSVACTNVVVFESVYSVLIVPHINKQIQL